MCNLMYLDYNKGGVTARKKLYKLFFVKLIQWFKLK